MKSSKDWSITAPRRAARFRSRAALPALVMAGFALSGCTSVGTGTGSVSPGGAPVAFSWKSTDGGITGAMLATLENGQTFSGPFLQITQQARSEDFGPMWNGWAPYWNDWPGSYWGPDFATLYSGRVIANLQSANGRMRCRFRLNTPVDGMSGGGQGQCQLDNGRSVDAVFPS